MLRTAGADSDDLYQVSLGKLKGDSALVAKGEAEMKKSEAEEKMGEEEEETGEAELIKGEAEVTKGKEEKMDGAVFGPLVYPLVLPMPVSAGGAVRLPHPLAVRCLRFSSCLFFACETEGWGVRQPEPEQPAFQYPGACDLICRKKLLLEAAKGEKSPAAKALLKKTAETLPRTFATPPLPQG